MLGDDREFELEWVSVYTFQCRRMAGAATTTACSFVGDAAHQVSPFGARGANSGIQDTDNLAWKLKLVLDGKAPASLLDSYSAERCYAADENIMNSTRSTDFITPKSNVSKAFRNAVLELAQDYPFARALVNSGRLSVPSWLVDSPLNTPDSDAFAGNMVPGAPMDDAPVSGSRTGWLLGAMDTRFQLLYYVEDASQISAAQAQALAALAHDHIRRAGRGGGQNRRGPARPANAAGHARQHRPALRPAAGHLLPAAPRPARGRPLAQL